MTNNANKKYKVTMLCKEDILQEFEEDENAEEIEKQIDKLTDNEMEYIAKRLDIFFCDQIYWSSLRYIVETSFLNKKGEKK